MDLLSSSRGSAVIERASLDPKPAVPIIHLDTRHFVPVPFSHTRTLEAFLSEDPLLFQKSLLLPSALLEIHAPR